MYGEKEVASNYDAMPIRDENISSIERINEISITEVDRGYIVRAGCKTFAISSKTELIEYINNPKDTEKKYYEGKLFL